jgi:hypothetical protein
MVGTFTIGHAARAIEDFLELLQIHAVEHVVDIRAFPGSRHNPQFGQDRLRDSLRNAGIEYTHLPSLGGRRRMPFTAASAAWRNASFRSYAEYLRTPEFAAGLEELVELASSRQVAIMCAEAVPWRCHRALVADALVARGIEVHDIMSATSAPAHRLPSFAHVEGTTVTYPATAPEPGSGEALQAEVDDGRARAEQVTEFQRRAFDGGDRQVEDQDAGRGLIGVDRVEQQAVVVAG